MASAVMLLAATIGQRLPCVCSSTMLSSFRTRPVRGLVELEVQRPDVVRPLSTQPPGGHRRVPQTLTLASLQRDAQPFFTPEPLHPLAIHAPALLAQRRQARRYPQQEAASPLRRADRPLPARHRGRRRRSGERRPALWSARPARVRGSVPAQASRQALHVSAPPRLALEEGVEAADDRAIMAAPRALEVEDSRQPLCCEGAPCRRASRRHHLAVVPSARALSRGRPPPPGWSCYCTAQPFLSPLYSVHAPQYLEGLGFALRALTAMVSTRVFRAAGGRRATLFDDVIVEKAGTPPPPWPCMMNHGRSSRTSASSRGVCCARRLRSCLAGDLARRGSTSGAPVVADLL